LKRWRAIYYCNNPNDSKDIITEYGISINFNGDKCTVNLRNNQVESSSTDTGEQLFLKLNRIYYIDLYKVFCLKLPAASIRLCLIEYKSFVYTGYII